jgi:integrase
VTPRIVPAVKIAPPREPERDRVVDAEETRAWTEAISVEERERRHSPYAGQLDPTWPRDLARPSFFRDLITVHAAEQRALKALEHPGLRGRDPGDPDDPHGDRELPEARRRLRPALRRAGIARPVRPWHDLRHTSLTHEAAAGNPQAYVQLKAGHSQGTITERYVHASQVLFPGAAERGEERMLGPVAEDG